MYTCPNCSQQTDKIKLHRNTLQPISCLRCWRLKITSPEDWQRYREIREMRAMDRRQLEHNASIINQPIEPRLSKRKERSDKGTKRVQYRKKVRQIKEDHKRLENIQKDIEKFERVEIKSERRMSHGERKRAKRLQSIPSPRICPFCNKPKLLSKQWVIRKDFIGCKSCLWRLKLIPTMKENNGVSSINSGETLEKDL